MIVFGFPESKRPDNGQYKVNFLKSVVFQIRYKEIDIRSYQDYLVQLFKDNFPILEEIYEGSMTVSAEKTPVLLSSNNSQAGIEFRSTNKRKVFSITKDYFSYTIFDNEYTNFENEYSLFLEYFKKFIIESKITQVTRIAQRKINIFAFDVDEQAPLSALDFIFNRNLIASYKSFPNSLKIDQAISKINTAENDFKAIISYGLNQKPNTQNINEKRIATLDIDIYREGQFSIEDYDPTMKNINNAIFNAFNYITSDHLKNIMEGKTNV